LRVEESRFAGRGVDVNVDVVLLVIGTLLFTLGVLSAVLKRLFLTTVLCALLLGVLLGPQGLGLIDPASSLDAERRVLELLARVTLAVALMAAGLQVTKGELVRDWRQVVSLLTIGMPVMCAVTAIGAVLILDVPIWMAILLGALLTPTDPVVASTLVTGRMAKANLSDEARRTLQVESAANDGLALPLVLFGLMLVPGGTSLGGWAFEAVKEVAIAVALGAVLGYCAGKVLETALHRWDIEYANLVTLGLALALAALGSVHLAGGSGVLGVFVAALVFSLVVEDQLRDELEEIEESLVNVLILPVFTFFGAMLPWAAWGDLGVTGLMFAAWVVLLRRPLAGMAALVFVPIERREKIFLGWFGPLGIGAVYYAVFIEKHHVPGYEEVFALATLAICASIVVQSLTATPGTRLFAGRSPWSPLKHPLTSDIES
jgi:NhaP-type Na+/H+ or K+/H+ antiporter